MRTLNRVSAFGLFWLGLVTVMGLAVAVFAWMSGRFA